MRNLNNFIDLVYILLDCIYETFSLYIQPFPKQQILDSSKLKEFADDKF